MECVICWEKYFWRLRRVKNLRSTTCKHRRKHYRKCDVIYHCLQISSYRIDLTSVDGPISPKQCYYEMDYSFYSFYWLDSLEIWLDHNSTHYRSLSKNSDVKRRISYCDPKTSNIRRIPSFDLLTVEFSKQVSIIRRALYWRQDGILILSIVDLFSISIGNTKNHVASLICLEWHTVKICLTFPS